MPTSENIRGLEPSATLAVAARARALRAQGRAIIDLSAGEPDFRTPDFISEAGIAAIQDGLTRYTAAAGLVELRQAIADDLARRSGKLVDASGVVVTAGAKQAIFNACFVLFGPGDRVLLPTPYWTSYPDIVRLARAEPIALPGDETHGFKVSVAQLERQSDERVRGLILNTPCNPTGAIYSLEELHAIATWAARRAIWIISDEIYGRLCYDGRRRAPGLLDLDVALLERTVLVDGVSKTFAMTGWRIGFSYSDAHLAGLMAALQSHITSSAATPAQHAAVAAYSAEPLEAESVHAMAETFHRRRDLLLSLFAEHLPQVSYVRPEGAFYLFFRTDRFYDDAAPDSVAFCARLLEQAEVALVPGAAFGDDRYVRLSFAASEDALAEGVRRIAAALGAGHVGRRRA
ncbi:MAG: pyridoxal phosphate-dependent aminotransferase [Gemmatimonadetes bacterium]|nr:pyridoxal phosphate-dependent aminotransferase [Gemmatimonadota bacterium]